MVKRILQDFNDIACDGIPTIKPKHGFEHHTETNYSAFDRELLAAYLAIRHFRHMLVGRVFHILTDHRPLTQALLRKAEPWSPRQTRQLSYISEYTSDVRYIAGPSNTVADALSRDVFEELNSVTFCTMENSAAKTYKPSGTPPVSPAPPNAYPLASCFTSTTPPASPGSSCWSPSGRRSWNTCTPFTIPAYVLRGD